MGLAPLIKAVAQGQVDDVRPLLTPGLDLDCDVFPAEGVRIQAMLLFNGRPEARWLQVCSPGEATTLLSMACVRGDARIVGALLDARASPDAGRTVPAAGGSRVPL